MGAFYTFIDLVRRIIVNQPRGRSLDKFLKILTRDRVGTFYTIISDLVRNKVN